jgi:glycerol-3-phosphate acyltransferase PlsY
VAQVLGVVVLSYLLGCLPVARVVAGRFGVDPTASGSGNPGASNVYRTTGRRAGAAVLIGDVAKGALAAGLGLAVGGRLLGLVAGLAAVVGHVAPATRRFRGGKGVATAAGAMGVLFPLATAAAAVVWIAVLAVTSVASVASLAATAVLVAGVLVAGVDGGELVVVGLMAATVLVRHAGNIGRLAQGAEHTVQAGLPSSSGADAPIPIPHHPSTPGAEPR